MRISGNTILITGGTSGIGLAFAEEFIKLGNKVIITGRRTERLQEIVTRLPGIVTKTSDVADVNQRDELAAWVKHNHPDTNILINNAGIQLAVDLTTPVEVTRIREELETNFVAPTHLASLFTEQLSGKDNAAIINITSGLAFVPLAFMPVYCATKAAMHSLSLSLRYQLKNKRIAVFEIAPPSVDTELGHERRADKTESHGGIPVEEFIEGAMEALKNDVCEAGIGQSAGLREKREALFEIMNSRF